MVQAEHEGRPHGQSQNFHSVQCILPALYKKTDKPLVFSSLLSFWTQVASPKRERESTRKGETSRILTLKSDSFQFCLLWSLPASENEVVACNVYGSFQLPGQLPLSAQIRRKIQTSQLNGETLFFFSLHTLLSSFGPLLELEIQVALCWEASWIRVALPWYLINASRLRKKERKKKVKKKGKGGKLK